MIPTKMTQMAAVLQQNQSEAQAQPKEPLLQLMERTMTQMAAVLRQNQSEAQAQPKEPLLQLMERTRSEYSTKWNNRDTGRPSIFRVPKDLREVDAKDYEPRFISFGPYHHGKDYLQAMEKLKWQYLNSFISRNKELGLKDYLKEVEALDKEVRSAYSEEMTMDSDDFVKIMLLDSCFILELLLRTYEAHFQDKASKEEKRSTVDFQRLMRGIMHDMVTLENQVPFFLLEKLLEKNNSSNGKTLVQLVSCPLLHYFKDLIFPNDQQHNVDDYFIETKPLHILHLFHFLITHTKENQNDEKVDITIDIIYSPNDQTASHADIPHNQTPCPAPSPANNESTSLLPDKISDSTDVDVAENPPENKKTTIEEIGEWLLVIVYIILGLFFLIFCFPCVIYYCIFDEEDDILKEHSKTIPRASVLTDAGVDFEKKSTPGISIVDVEFDDGVMKIPPLTLLSNTHIIIRNLIAYEQHFSGVGTQLTNYGHLMDCLIDKGEDLEVLKKARIISNIGDESSAADTFNKINKYVVRDANSKSSSLDQLFHKVEDHCKRKRNLWRAKLMKDYCGNPWATISVIAAAFLIVLTVLQTVYTVLSYQKPPN